MICKPQSFVFRFRRLVAVAITSLLCSFLLCVSIATAQHADVPRPESWNDLVPGARFMDRFEPIPLLQPRVSAGWGVDDVRQRDVQNGIEDDSFSYWGGNILQDDDGRFHLFVCRWDEDHPKGHMAWRESIVVRATSDHRLGPYRVAEIIGQGHNPEAYRTADGRVVCYVIDRKFECQSYVGRSITGPWEKVTPVYDTRDRKIIANLSNNSFSRREDGSFLMVNRGGGMWVSRDGLAPWEQITQGSNYPKVEGRFEDPVLWRSNVQYHMIVNDWYGRIAYHLRSKNGVHWKVDPGEAYMPGIAVSQDGQSDDWYKYERIKIFQDEHGRGIQANFAVIDFSKHDDLPNDQHSSKNISIPLKPGRLLTLSNPTAITDETAEVRLRIDAEVGFDPIRDLDLESLRFGAPEEVDFGRGATLIGTEPDDRGLVLIFAGKDCNFEDHHFAGKLIGRTRDDQMTFGYCRLPWVTYIEPVVTAKRPETMANDAGQWVLRIPVANHGQVDAATSKISVQFDQTDPIILGCPPLKPYQSANVVAAIPDDLLDGKPHQMTIGCGIGITQTNVFVADKVRLPAK
ncbi:glycoside hydrolase family protein [Crateriforma spongiae]|uniref:glycoside hydrolase family protein n=1 Tax=Crateriforma spongiae TaxID=2724528 RepID=UPI0014474028|nr:glycoside hydrolase family protein [Crateriforma spongiae]